MKRPTKLIVLALLLLVAAAWFFRREPKEERPARAPKPRPVVEASPPEPQAIAVVPEAPKPPPPKPKPPASKPPEPAPVAVDRSKLGIIRGGVRILGTPPPRKPVRMSGEPKCAELHTGVVLNEDLVVDPYGGVRWAFVYVKSGLNGTPPPASRDPVILDQIVCVFTPHMLGIRIGQPLLIRNSDPMLHNAHGLPFENREFNSGLQPFVEETRRFSKKEIMFKVKCDIHPWMSAWVGVMDHPYFAVTGETGAYALPDLPAGRYAVEVWHEKYASVSSEVDVVPGGDVPLDFILDARKN